MLHLDSDQIKDDASLGGNIPQLPKVTGRICTHRCARSSKVQCGVNSAGSCVESSTKCVRTHTHLHVYKLCF